MAQPSAGQVFIDGRDATDLPTNSLRPDRQADWAIHGYYLPNSEAALAEVKAS